MVKRFEAFCFYYRTFFEELASQVGKSWRAEVRSAVGIAILVLLLSYRQDPNAKTAFVYTGEACLIYVFGWALYHLVRTPWQLSLRPPRPFPRSRVKRPIDLQGSILEVYTRHPDEFYLPITRAFVYINVRIENLGTDETTVAAFGLQIELGSYRKAAELIEIPDDLRIKRPREGVFTGTAFDELPLAPSLSALHNDLIYAKARPHEGWLAFEVYMHGTEEISNVKFDVLLKDSLGDVHCISRNPGVYRKTGQLVTARKVGVISL
jgi:hypothetical protein